MVQTECALERFLLENPPTEKNIEKAGQELSDIQQDFLTVLSTNPKVIVSFMSSVSFTLFVALNFKYTYVCYCLSCENYKIYLN